MLPLPPLPLHPPPHLVPPRIQPPLPPGLDICLLLLLLLLCSCLALQPRLPVQVGGEDARALLLLVGVEEVFLVEGGDCGVGGDAGEHCMGWLVSLWCGFYVCILRLAS